MSVSLCVWHAMGAVLSWFTFHLSGFLLETVDIFKQSGVSNKSLIDNGKVITACICFSLRSILLLILPLFSWSLQVLSKIVCIYFLSLYLQALCQFMLLYLTLVKKREKYQD